MTQSNTSLQIIELVKPSSLEEFRTGGGYGQFKCVTKDGKRCKFFGKPDTCCPSFLISGVFRVTNNGIHMITKEKYTYTYKNPNQVTREDVNHFVQELELYTKKGEVVRKQLFDAVPCSVNAFRALPAFTKLEMETKCDYFRVEFEVRLKIAFPGNAGKLAIRQLTGTQLKEVDNLLKTRIWKLWFDVFCKPFKLKEMSYEGYLAYQKAFDQKLPSMYFLAFRIYHYLKKLRKDFGHDLFAKQGLYHRFCASPGWAVRCTVPEFEAAMRFLLCHGLSDAIEGFLVLPKDLRANLHIIDSLSKIKGTSILRGNEVPCMPSVSLTDQQQAFVRHVHRNPITLLQGPPGTGKTEGLVALMTEFKAPLVVTFGGRMVCALHERFGGEETAHTIHHVCCVREYLEEAGKQWLSQFDLLVIDEGSNVDAHLFSRLIRHMSHVARLVIVGDLGQIFPIKAGCPFNDLVDAFPQHCFVLTENKRVDPDSRGLADDSARINRGEMPQALHLHQELSRDQFNLLLDMYGKDIMSMQIVTLRNADRRLLNKWCEEYLLQHKIIRKTVGRVVRLGTEEYFPGKKIMFTQNVKPVLDKESGSMLHNGYKNGELGEILHIESNPMRVTLTNGKSMVLNDAFDICPGYATTCNKAQGSEWKTIIFWICNNPTSFFTREFPYVAVSRAKKNCHVMVNHEDDLRSLISRRANRRHTILTYLLAHESLPNLTNLVDFDNVELKDLSLLKPLPKGVDAVPRLESFVEQKTTKQGKRTKLSTI